MTKNEYMACLRKKLAVMPQKEVEEQLSFYSEMIDDRIEEGLSEEEAIRELGGTDDVASDIVSGIPLVSIVKERLSPKRRVKVWEIVLIALGSPIWLSLLIAAFSVLISLLAVVASLIVSLWAVFGASVGCAVGFVAAGSVFAVFQSPLTGIATVGAGLFLAGLAIYLFYGCKAATAGVLHLIKLLVFSMKKCFVGKESAR